MSKQQFEERKFARKTAIVIEQANEIMEEYDTSVSLRQLYYQFVARDLMENTIRNYKKLGDIIRNGRMAGLISWDLLQDRSRSLFGQTTYDDVDDFLSYQYFRYKENRWKHQDEYVEIWVEKDALSSVVGRAASEYQVNYFPTKGYPSLSSLKDAADRLIRKNKMGKNVTILYLSDHDPEGLQMPQSVATNLEQFGADVTVKRVGLTMEQVRQYRPPASSAKDTSSRFQNYVDETGTTDVWELDALKPEVIQDLLRTELEKIVDRRAFNESAEHELIGKENIRRIGRNHHRILEFLDSEGLF